jgi:hypothetical protein
MFSNFGRITNGLSVNPSALKANKAVRSHIDSSSFENFNPFLGITFLKCLSVNKAV